MPLSVEAYRTEVRRRVAERMAREAQDNAEEIRARCRSFAVFARDAWKVIEPWTELRWNWHLDAVTEHLEAISSGKMSPWLIINEPPGSSKSTFVSVLWQAFEWGPLGRPGLRYVSTSFEKENVTRDTRKCRDLIRSDWYRTLWPDVELVRAGETSFANSHTGSREGVPFGSITGKRGDRVVIDDPHSIKGAESEVERDKAVRLFLEGGLNRTNDALNSAMIIVMQRVHENDLSGALLARNLGFVHLMIPMEFEPERRFYTPIGWTDPRSNLGELMDPGRFPQEAAERQKEASEYAWAGQYQQRPAPREGGMFKIREDWALPRSEGGMVVDCAPAGGDIVGAWDIAGSKRKKSPFTVRVKMKQVGGDYFLVHVHRRRTDPTELNSMVEEVAIEDGRDVLQSLPQDPGAVGKVVKWNWADLLAGFNFKITPESGGNKETRAEPYAAQWNAGRVFMVRGPWNGPYIDELRNFPSGLFKDQVDASSRGFGELMRMKANDDGLGVAGPIIPTFAE